LNQVVKNQELSFQGLVINVSSRVDRRKSISSHLENLRIPFRFFKAIEPNELAESSQIYLSKIAECVWNSHLGCLRIASATSYPTLIIEDDAIIKIGNSSILKYVELMNLHNLDFIQIGYLNLNVLEAFSIKLRNAYNFMIKYSVAQSFLEMFGFKEIGRARTQVWRSELPGQFVVNDIRYGAHCYLVSPKFALSVLSLNSPPFLAADDFFVALSKMKTFRMIRLTKSLSSQDNSPSSFQERYLLE
jgi:GR25 family glycosyltransferase involved in LPS biosynthesis